MILSPFNNENSFARIIGTQIIFYMIALSHKLVSIKFAVGGFLFWICHCGDDVQRGHLGARPKRRVVAVRTPRWEVVFSFLYNIEKRKEKDVAKEVDIWVP